MTSSASNVAYELCIDIGDTPICLRTSNPEFRDLIKQRYAGFLTRPMRAKSTFDIDCLPVPATPPEIKAHVDPSDDDGPALVVRHERGQWYLRRDDFQAEWNAATRWGKIAQVPNPYTIDTFLRILHSLILAGEGGFLLHAASAVRNGKAFLFSGISGAGKTTITRLAPPDAIVLTDEISYVRCDGDQYRACGTPFAGELARVGENTQGPVDQLFFLAQGPANRIESISPPDALRMLLRNILFFADDSALVESVFRSACQFLERVPVSRLTFYPDVHVWDLIG
jgi:hypothetical protein